MKNLAKLFLQSKQQSGKTKPRESATTARKVGQMRNTVRQMTGYKKGGTMENPKKQDRRVGKYESKKNTAQQRGRDKVKGVRKRITEILEMTKGAGKELIGKQKGGVARTSKGARQGLRDLMAKRRRSLRDLMAKRRRTKMSPMQMDRKREGYRAKVEKGGGKVMFADEMGRLKGESKKSQKSRIKKGLKLKAGGLAMRGYGIAKRGH
jgi:hypothetical protein